MSSFQPAIGFAGIGLMGLPICQRLLAAGLDLSVWNRSADKCLPLLELGARAVQLPEQLCRQADIIFLCLADSAAVHQVVFGPGGLVYGARSGQLLIDLSSCEPAATREMAAELHARCGMRWIDAPVSGGTPGAAAGTLAIMAGGAVEDLQRATPLLQLLGQRVTHMGPLGAGQVTKLCNQMIVACNALVIAEALALAERGGVDSGLLAEALAGGFADSKPLQILAPQMAGRCFEPVRWHVRTLLKDLDSAIKLSRDAASATPMSALAAQLMRLHAQQGAMHSDPSTLIRLFEHKG
jgi:3-hydroxyisobutyrate dehydrogenase